MKKIKILFIVIISNMLLALICPTKSNADAITFKFDDSELAEQVKNYFGDDAKVISGNMVTIADETAINRHDTSMNLTLSECKSLNGLEKVLEKTKKINDLHLNIKSETFNLDLSVLKDVPNLEHFWISGPYPSNTNLTVSGLSSLKSLKNIQLDWVNIDKN